MLSFFYSRFSQRCLKFVTNPEMRTMVTEAATEGSRVKHRVPVKRASKLLNELKTEEFENLKNGRQWPQIRSGDAIEVEKFPFASSPTTNMIKGVVVGISNKASDTNIRLLNNENGTMVYRIMPMYNPLIKNIRIIQKGFIHKGGKRVRRSKLYYLLDRHPETYTVK